MKDARQNYLKNAISAAANSKDRWHKVNHLLHSAVSSFPVCNLTADDICSFFSEKISNIHSVIGSNLVGLIYSGVAYNPVECVFDCFDNVSIAEAHEAIQSLTKPSPLDIVPLELLKGSSRVFSVLLSRLANITFNTGVFPSKLKTAMVKPLLKKPDLDPNNLASYRPISNLSSFEKIIERLAFVRISRPILNNQNFSNYQSGYRPFHSTETATVKILNDLINNTTTGQPSLLLSLDLSAAFDCVIHTKLLDRLSDEFGIRGKPLDWLKSYLSERSQYVFFNETKSSILPVKLGVPQGSVLGPLLFSIYTCPITRLVANYGFSCHSYADDTTIYFSLEGNISDKLNQLNNCTIALRTWLLFHGLQLNPIKSEVLIVGTNAQVKRFNSLNTQIAVANNKIEPKNSLKLLGVTFDAKLDFNQHVSSISKSINYQLRAFRHIRKFLDVRSANIVASAIIGSRLDYCNAILTGITGYNMNRLQRLQIYAAKIVLNDYKNASHRYVNELHWLPVQKRIEYKIAFLTFKSLQNHSPKYLFEMLKPYSVNRSLRSNSQFLLEVPPSKSSLNDRAFNISAPKIFNSLPLDLRKLAFERHTENQNLNAFKKQLKTHLFRTLTSTT